MNLVTQLTERLGISQEQATQAAGMIFKFAKKQLSGTEYSQLSQSLPDDVDALANSAPDEKTGGGLAGAIGSIASAVGGKAGGTAQMAGLAAGLSKVGIDSSRIPQLIEVVKSYAEKHGGPQIRDLLTKAVGT